MGLTQFSDKPASAMAVGVDLGVLQDVEMIKKEKAENETSVLCR